MEGPAVTSLTQVERASGVLSHAEDAEPFRAMFEATSIGMAQTDLATRRFLHVNAAYCALTGYSEDELLALTLDELNHSEDCECDREAYGRLLRGESSEYRSEKRYRRKDGSIVWVEATGNLLRDREGRPLRAMAAVQDITARKQAEERLRESEERFHVAQESSTIAFTILRAVRGASGTIEDFKWEYVNPAAARILRRPAEALIGQRLLCVLPGNRAHSDLFASYVRVVESGKAHNIELRYEADGIAGWFHNIATPHGDGVAVWFMDVSERKRAEAQLRSWAEQLSMITDTMSALVTRCSRDLRYLWVSRPYARWLGRSPEKIIGSPIVEVIGEQALAAIQPHIERVLRGEQVQYEEEVDFAGIGTRFIQAMYSPTFDPAGVPDGWVAVVLDMTERKRAEEHGDLLVHELNHRVKNTLAVVQSIAAQTLRRAHSLDQFRLAFGGRLEALAAAHELLLAQGGWADVLLRELIERTLSAVVPRERLELEGPPVTVSAYAAVSLGMAFHELATNAAKYGALSRRRGQVRVSWNVTEPEGQLLLEWRESGGPPAEAPPAQARGFGSRLIEQVARELGAGIEREWGARGLTCHLTLPLGAHVTLGARKGGSEPMQPESPSST